MLSGESHLTRLDYCNATFAGVANEQIVHIQKIQNLNNAAQLLLKKLKRAHVTPLLKELHWLPVKYCIQYMLTTLAFRHIDSTLPPYLSSSLCPYQAKPPSFFNTMTTQNSKDKLENFWWMFFWLHCSSCLELLASQPESFTLPPNFQS